MKSAKTFAFAAALIALWGGIGAAEAALVLSNLKVRTGPGPEYPVITVIPGGSNVQVADCAAGWCRVFLATGKRGYVSQEYLDVGGPAAYAVPPPYRVAPPVVVAPYPYPYYRPYYRSYYYDDYYYGRPYYPYYRRYWW
jgi:uncharacterized protein YraI